MDTLSVGFLFGLVLFLFGEVFNGQGGWFWHLCAVMMFCTIAFNNGKTTILGHPQYTDIGALERGVKYTTYKVPIPNPAYKYYVFLKEAEAVPVFYQFSSEVEIPEGNFIRPKTR